MQISIKNAADFLELSKMFHIQGESIDAKEAFEKFTYFFELGRKSGAATLATAFLEELSSNTMSPKQLYVLCENALETVREG